jgi:uncharacterized repeat protein (TIGR01451 family)/gliding motility-associated-like protein
MKKLIISALFMCLSIIGYAQAPTYINTTTTFFAGSGLAWYGDVTFGPNAIVYIEDGAMPIFFGKNMVIDPAARFISLPGNNQIGTGKIIFRDNNPLYPSYPLQQTLNGGYTTGINPSLLNIEVDNANGVSLLGNTRITNNVQFTRGHIYLNNFNLVLDNDATFSNYDVNKHVVTNGTGVIVKESLPNAASFIFPVSIAGLDYTPASVTNTSATRNINVQVKNYTASASIETIFATKGMDRTWQISSNIAGAASLSLTHNALTNANGAGTNEIAFNNEVAYITQQQTLGVWAQACGGADGGTPVNTLAANAILPATVDPTAFFTKQSVVCTDLRVVKSVNNAIPNVGSYLTFSITVTNLGPIAATGVNVTDLLPSGYTFVSATTATGSYNHGTGVWAIGNLLNAGSVTLDIVALVNAAGNYANTATVSGNEEDPVLTNNTSTVTPVPGAIQANLAVLKTVSNATPVIGDNVTFTITANNIGPNDATGVKVTDLLPSGYSYISATVSAGTFNNGTGVWTIGNFANGANASLTITVKVNATGSYANTATIIGNEPDPVLGNNTSTITPTPTVLKANLAVVKTVNNTNPFIGDNVTFTIAASNTGPNSGTGVKVTDILPAGYTYVSSTVSIGTFNSATGIWTIGDLANGANANLTITAKVNATGSYANTATIIGNELDPDLSNNTSTITPSPVLIQTDLKVVKTINNATPTIGSNVIFTIAASNLGPNNATGVKVTDILPAGYTYVSATTSIGAFNNTTGIWTIGDFANGGNAILTITAKVNATGPYANTATITGNENDPILSNNTSTVNMLPAAIVQANLAVVKTASTLTPVIGNNIVFTIAASNLGPNNATGVKVTDILTAGYSFVSATVSTGAFNSATGIWTIGDLANGANATLTLTAKVNATGSYVNTATVTGNETDPDLSNNTSTISPVPATIMQANLAVVKTVNTVAPVIGNNVVFTIVASNLGPNNATGAKVTEVLPLGYTFVSASVSTGAFNNTTGLWTIGDLANGANATLTITAKVNAAGSYANTATITGNEPDIDLSNNTSTVATAPVVLSTNLSVVKTVSNLNPIVGSNVVFTIVATNLGSGNATGVKVTDVLPNGYTYVSDIPRTGTFANSNSTWIIGDLANGASVTLTITAKVNAVGPYANTATVTGNELDPDLSNNSSTVTPVPTTGMANLSIQKTATNAIISVGSEFDYTIVVKNIGVILATEVVSTDILPAGLTYVSSVASKGTVAYNNNTRTVSWNVGSLDVGATTTLTLKVKATQAGKILNTASVSGKEAETIITDNTSVATVDINGLQIPNVITPDGDGKNDTFKILGLNAYPENKLIIYNRWGNEVWHSVGSTYNNEWSGYGLNGGTYYYVLTLKGSTGKWETLTGWILLLKD